MRPSRICRFAVYQRADFASFDRSTYYAVRVGRQTGIFNTWSAISHDDRSYRRLI